MAMKPLSPPTNKARTVCVDDIHHRTADQSRSAAGLAAKAMKHAERQQGARRARAAITTCQECEHNVVDGAVRCPRGRECWVGGQPADGQAS